MARKKSTDARMLAISLWDEPAIKLSARRIRRDAHLSGLVKRPSPVEFFRTGSLYHVFVNDVYFTSVLSPSIATDYITVLDPSIVADLVTRNN